MSVPTFLSEIADDIRRFLPRRMKVRTLMNKYGLRRRRAQGLSAIRADLTALGITTEPDFEAAGMDEQVRFVVIGGPTLVEIDLSGIDSSRYGYSEIAGPEPRIRIALPTYDSYERLLKRVVDNRLGKVYENGQNPRREDRDTFPFHLILALSDQYDEHNLCAWIEEDLDLGAAEIDSAPPVTPPAGAPATFDFTSVQDHMSDIYEGLRAEFASQVSDLRSAMERKVDEIRFDAIQKLAQAINNDEAAKLIEDYETEIRAKLDQKDGELREQQKEINLLQSRLADLNDELTAAAIQSEYDPSDAYPTMTSMVRLFQDICDGGHISIHENALRSAQRSNCTRRREVLQFLLTLQELANLTYERGGVGKQLKDWFGERGYEYAQSDSQIASTKYGDERKIQIGGACRQMGEHVTLFPNTANCTTVYFLRDDAEKELVVGYVGPHLRTAGR